MRSKKCKLEKWEKEDECEWNVKWKWVKWYRILNKWWEGKNLNFKFGQTLGTEKVGKEPFLKPFSSQPV
jgi:hypothetical protein